MFQDIKKHKIAYSLLAVFSAIYLVTVYVMHNTKSIVMIATIGFGVGYLIWGISHHLLEKSLTSRLVLEYILVTALGLVIMSTIVL